MSEASKAQQAGPTSTESSANSLARWATESAQAQPWHALETVKKINDTDEKAEETVICREEDANRSERLNLIVKKHCDKMSGA